MRSSPIDLNHSYDERELNLNDNDNDGSEDAKIIADEACDDSQSSSKCSGDTNMNSSCINNVSFEPNSRQPAPRVYSLSANSSPSLYRKNLVSESGSIIWDADCDWIQLYDRMLRFNGRSSSFRQNRSCGCRGTAGGAGGAGGKQILKAGENMLTTALLFVGDIYFYSFLPKQ